MKALFAAMFADGLFTHAPVFEEATAGEQLYVALVDGAIAAFASVWEPDRFIHFLYVSPSYRRKKLASALISSLAARCGGQLTLKCLVKNEAAMAFYRSTGWETVETGSSEDGAYALLRYPADAE